MKVLLVGPDYEENLSIRYLSASLLSGGHDTVLATFNSSADIASVADSAQDADIVGLSMCFQSRAPEFLRLARLIKSRDPNKLIVAGGHYASCAAEPLLANHPELDIIVIHEGERTLVEIAEALPQLADRISQIPGIAFRDRREVRFTPRRKTLDDLDSLPIPDRRGPVHSIAGVPTSYMMGSRGCYGSCAYCCITTLHRMAPGRRFRQRNVERIADEMAALYRERGTRQFVFHDDNFLVTSEVINHARLSAFEKALRKRCIEDIALVIKCRPADAKREVLRRLKDMGLVRLFVGVESSTTRGLSALERKQSVEDSERALETCRELDISAQFTLMIFNPDATLETMRSDVTFMRRFCGNPLNFCRAEIYAGTPLEKRMLELKRARGDYLARAYSLSDPRADLACNISLDLFESRCWGDGSLMQRAIGLDHTASVLKRFHATAAGAALCARVGSWLQSVNLDTIDLLDGVIELSDSTVGSKDLSLQHAILALREREAKTRQKFLSDSSYLKTELEAFRFTEKPSQFSQLLGSRLRLARRVAAAVLAVGMPATSGLHQAVAQEVQTPSSASSPAQDAVASMMGSVKDQSGAVIPNATVTITNLDTQVTRTLKSSSSGEYVANDLPAGPYAVKVEATAFRTTIRTGIVLRPGGRERADFVLEIGNWGCCEYVAVPLVKTIEDLTAKQKPFVYIVGDADDHNTSQGIARLVYGDPNKWVQIFEANRKAVAKPGIIPEGTPILIPPSRRAVPKLLHKVMPIYPPTAEKEHVRGDVVLDVTLNEDGTVQRVDVIDGYSLLADAATSAVKQWRYRPLLVNGKRVDNFVVVISFDKQIKIQ